MAVTMQGKLMSMSMNLPDNIRVLFGTFSNQEERRAYVISCQHIEQARRIVRVRAIVERKRNFGAGWVTVEQDIGIAVLRSIVQAQKGARDIPFSDSQELHFSIIIVPGKKWKTKSSPELLR